MKSTYPADELSTGLGACLRAPSWVFPAVFDLNCCLLLLPVLLVLVLDAFAALPAVAAVPFMLAETGLRGGRPQ